MKSKRAIVYETESQRLAETFPALSLRPQGDGLGLITGSLEVAEGIAYSTRLIVPSEYPNREPVLVCDPHEIPWDIDRHVCEKNGIACLCARSETRILWPWGNDLADFIEKLVKPFFIGQFYFDTHENWPPTGERSHGRPGIIETFRELLSSVDDLDEKKIQAFLRLLGRKNHPGGHETCPCGSGQRLRHCHRELLRELRASIDPRHAELDLSEAFGNKSR